jgi:hypothetical protein
MAKDQFQEDSSDREQRKYIESFVWEKLLGQVLVMFTTQHDYDIEAKIAECYDLIKEKTVDELTSELKTTQPGYVNPESLLDDENRSLYSTCLIALINIKTD